MVAELTRKRVSLTIIWMLRTIPKYFSLGGLIATLSLGCRPSEPTPTYYQDLGTEERPLLPTSATWHDASLAKGTADWHPFRKPDSDAKLDDASATPAGSAEADPRLISEILEAVKEFNAAVASERFDELADFLIEVQASPVRQVIEILPQFAAKLTDLAAALPGDNENLKKVAAALTLDKVLKLEVGPVQMRGEDEAVAQLSGGPAEVRFRLVKEEEGEFWYIDHPQIRALAPSLSAIQQSTQQLEAMTAGIKSGEISEETASQQASAMNQMLSSFMPPGAAGSQPSKDTPPASDEEPDGAGGDEE